MRSRAFSDTAIRRMANLSGYTQTHGKSQNPLLPSTLYTGGLPRHGMNEESNRTYFGERFKSLGLRHILVIRDTIEEVLTRLLPMSVQSIPSCERRFTRRANDDT